MLNWFQQPRKKFRKKIVRNRLETRYKIVISLNCSLGNHFRVVSGNQIVIGNGVKIGEKCSIYERVTIGQRYGKVPKIGNNVIIHRGAVIIGDVSIGDNAVINENSVVIHNVPSGAVVEGTPARIIFD